MKFVFLYRESTIDIAISLYIAIETDIWQAHGRTDYDNIINKYNNLEIKIDDDKLMKIWNGVNTDQDYWKGKAGLKPDLELSYEDLVADFPKVLRTVCRLADIKMDVEVVNKSEGCVKLVHPQKEALRKRLLQLLDKLE
jgi:LPS sulfotransferase NodH